MIFNKNRTKIIYRLIYDRPMNANLSDRSTVTDYELYNMFAILIELICVTAIGNTQFNVLNKYLS